MAASTLDAVRSDYDRTTKFSYGEEKHILDDASELVQLSDRLGELKSNHQLAAFERESGYTLHDLLFFNNFFLYYLKPQADELLTDRQQAAIGSYPSGKFLIEGVPKVKMKHFVYEWGQVSDYADYLGMID